MRFEDPLNWRKAMKKNRLSLTILSIFFILPFLFGCPYESKVPLSKVSKATIDPALIGEWKYTVEEESFTMVIQQFNDHELLIMGIEDGEVQQEAFRAFVTVIKDERFLNVQEIEESYDERVWYFVKYTISGDTLTTWIVDDKLFTKPVTSSRALFRFVKKHLHDKTLFSDVPFLVLKRVGE
jgi:hypothetical protein